MCVLELHWYTANWQKCISGCGLTGSSEVCSAVLSTLHPSLSSMLCYSLTVRGAHLPLNRTRTVCCPGSTIVERAPHCLAYGWRVVGVCFTMWLACGCHVVAMWLGCCCHVVAMWLTCCWCVVSVWLTSGCRVVGV